MRIHRYLAALCLAAPLCAADTADAEAVAVEMVDTEPAYEDEYDEDYGEDYEEPSDRVYTEAEMEAALQKFAELNNKMAELLNGVNDRASADAAAPAYTALEKELHEDELDRALQQLAEKKGYSVLVEHLSVGSETEKKLEEAYYYGSTALAKAVSGDASDALQPVPLTPEVQAALLSSEEPNERHVIIMNGVKASDEKVSGGPGFSRETAWVCAAENRREASFMAQMILMRRYEGSVSIANSKEVSEDGHVYQVFTADFVHEETKYRGDVWVDITSGCKAYTPEQQQAVLDKITGSIREVSAIVAGIKDKATADAAAERLPELIQVLMNPGDHDILLSIDEEKVQEAIKAASPSKEEQRAIKERIIENDYYGSEKLKKIL